MTKDKLQIGTDILKASLCKKEGVFYYWEGSAENSTVAVSSADMVKIDLEYDRLQAEEVTNAYKAQRAAEYPPITDYIDGVVKGDQAQIDKYIADCLAVKAKYPKGAA
jgi:2-keto-3-deoxy-L-rhamnonate aldolase RhmA